MNFKTDVIERSHEKPVLVDFWAEWCGPCKVLTPVLEALDAEDDRWELVKVNTEEHQEIAMEYKIMSIPNVKLFYKGSMIDEFVGALPKTAVEQWLNDSLPGSEKGAWMELKASEGQWPDMVYVVKLEEFVQSNTENKDALLDLAKHLVLSEPTKALEIVDTQHLTHVSPETITDIRALAQLMSLENQEAPDRVTELMLEVQERLNDKDLGMAAKGLVDVAMLDKSAMDGLPQKAGVALFRMLGQTNDVTRQFRRLFDMALY